MQRNTKIAIAVAVVAGIGVVSLAATGYAHRGWYGHHGWAQHGQYGDHGNKRHGGRMLYRLMDRYDANQDGKLTQAEIDETRRNQFARFDADGDGVLTLAEYQALWLDVMRERMVHGFQRHDADGDAKVTPAEFNKRLSRLIERMDRNDDGVLDKNDHRRRHAPDKAAAPAPQAN